MTQTLAYYNEHAEQFIAGTVDANMTALYDFFLKHIPLGGKILDLGCGSGRDTKAFMERGYSVVAVDGSAACCEAASTYIGQEVRCCTFDQIDYQNKFDGIWACASLLHLPKRELVSVFEKLATALKVGGTLYCSFKYGGFEGERNGRYFTDLTEDSLKEILENIPALNIKDVMITKDVREGRDGEQWLNIVLNQNLVNSQIQN